MRRFRLIEHTADVGLIAYGSDIAESFANAAYGMFSIMIDMRTVRLNETRMIELAENNSENLLFSWLNELLYFFDAEKLLFRQFDIERSDGLSIKAKCTGEKVDPVRHHLKTGVKSATYHMLQVDSQKNQVRVIFDI